MLANKKSTLLTIVNKHNKSQFIFCIESLTQGTSSITIGSRAHAEAHGLL